jgi:hypothetical protein
MLQIRNSSVRTSIAAGRASLMNAHHKGSFLAGSIRKFGSSITKSFVALIIDERDKKYFGKQGSPRFSLRV